MLIKASILKILNAFLALGGMSLFSYLTNQIDYLLYFLYFNAVIVVSSSVFDFGLNAVNSSVMLSKHHYFVPPIMKKFFEFRIDYLVSIFLTIIFSLMTKSNFVTAFGILLCIYLRIFIMRWMTIERKEVSVTSSIVRADIPLTILNSVTIYFLTLSELTFLIFQVIGYFLIFYSLNKTESFSLLWNFEKNRIIFASPEHGLSVVLQSYLSAFKNNITGLLLGGATGNLLESIFLANRLGQIFLVPYSGVLVSIPRLLKIQNNQLNKKWINIIVPPFIFSIVIIFKPELLIFIVNFIYNSNIFAFSELIILFLLLPSLLAFLNVYLIAKGKQSTNIALDLAQILIIGVSIKCVVL